MPAGTELFGISASLNIDSSQFDKEIDEARQILNSLSDAIEWVKADRLESEMDGAADSAAGLGETLDDELDPAMQKAKEDTEGLGKGIGEDLPEQVDKGKNSILGFSEILKADFVKGAIGVAISAVKKLGDAITGIAGSALSSYADYEQLVGGVETIFGDASDKIIAYSEEAYKNAGMSANAYLDAVMGIGTALISGLKEQAVALSEEELEAREKALDDQYEATKDALEEEYKLKQEAYTNEYKLLKKTLDREYEARKRQLDEVYDSVSESLDREISAYQKAAEKRLEAAEKAYEEDVEAYKKATEARIKEIDREYLESIKLIDEERYERLKAIDDQIDALNGLTEAERAAQKKRERQRKISSLREAVAEADTLEDRQKAEEALSDYQRQLAQEDREAQRKEQIDALKDQKDAINDEADARKSAAKDQRDAAVEAVNEEKDATLKAMKEQYSAQKEAMKEAQDAELDAMRKSKSDQLKALKYAQSEELASLKDSQSEQLDAVKNRHSDELAELKKANGERLKEMEKQVKAEKALLLGGVDVSGLSQEELAAIYDEAADIANRAMNDMSDVANKMGASLESVMSAVIGMSRGNYTMLDNLRLGYAGTAEGAQKMLTQAEQIKAAHGETVSYTLGNMADMLEALHVVLQNMEITGTTEDEAVKTISGSFGALQASWEDLIAGLGRGDADIEELTNNLVGSAEAYWGNLKPALETIFENLGEALSKLLPIISSWADENLPAIIESLKGFISDIWNGIAPELPNLASTVLGDIRGSLEEEFPTALPLLELAFGGWILKGITGGVKSIGGAIGDVGKSIASTLSGGLGSTVATAGGVGATITAAGTAIAAGLYDVTKLKEAHDTYKDAQDAHARETEDFLERYRYLYETKGKEVADELAMMTYQIDLSGADLDQAQEIIAGKIEGLWADVPQNMADGFRHGWDDYFGDGKGIKGIPKLVVDGFGGMLNSILDVFGIDSPSKEFKKIAKNNALGYKEGWEKYYPGIVEIMLSSMEEIGKSALDGFEKGWVENLPRILDMIKAGALSIADTFKATLDIHSPSGVFEGFGENTPEGYIVGVRKRLPEMRAVMEEMSDTAVGGFQMKSMPAPLQPVMAAQARESAPRDVTTVLTLNEHELGRVIYRLYNDESRRMGTVLVRG